MRKVIIIGMVLIMVGFFGSPSSAKDTLEITSLHKTLAQGKAWLNTERPLQAEDLKGRLILIDFWTFCCINCIHVIPKLQELEAKYHDQLTVIGIHSAKFANEKDSSNIRNAILRYGIEHPVINDADFNLWQHFSVRAWPTLLLISPDGTIYRSYAGEGDIDEISRDIDKLISTYDDKINKSPLPLALEKNKAEPTYLSFPGKLIYVSQYDGAPALFIADSSHNRIIGTRLDGQTFVVIGSGAQGRTDGTFESASFSKPQGLLYKDNLLYVADTENHLLRRVDLKNKIVETIGGTGERGMILSSRDRVAKTTAMASPWDLAFYPDEDHIAIAMAGTHQLWSYSIPGKTVSVLAGNGRESIDDGGFPYNSLSQPSGLSSYGDKLYFVDSETSSLRVLDHNAEIKTLIGTGLFDFGLRDGDANSALMQHSLGLATDDKGAYITDSYNHAIRFYDFATKKLSTLIGTGKAGNAQGSFKDTLMNEPNAIVKAGSSFFVADTNNSQILMLDMNSRQAKKFDIQPPASQATYVEPSKLPNVIQAPDATISTTLTEIDLDLPKTWKINHDAPSYLALFKISKDQKNAVASFNYKDLEKLKVHLKHLETDTSYVLQGTFYYCPKENPTQCLIQSYHQDFKTKDGPKSVIGIALKTN